MANNLLESLFYLDIMIFDWKKLSHLLLYLKVEHRLIFSAKAFMIPKLKDLSSSAMEVKEM